MSGIVFFRCEDRDSVVEFYENRLDFEEWLEQEAGCTILRRENLLLGFCDGEKSESEGIITVVVEDRAAVDAVYDDLSDVAEHRPEANKEFDIYQFFATDPDDRTVEVQTFLHETPERP